MRFSLATCITLVLACWVSRSTGVDSSSSTDSGYDAWSKLEISPLAFQHMDYNYKQIDIYAHAKNNDSKDVARKKYYFIPLCELHPASAVSKWNDITRHFEVNFQVYMWDQKLKQAVWEFLQTYEPGLKIHQIQVLPIDKVALRCQDCQDFTVLETPQRYSSLPHKVDFKFQCSTRERCDEIASRMKSNPLDFNGLNLVFALQNQRSETKKISVSSNVAFNGELFTKLRSEFPNKDSAYLTADDAKKLLAQSVQEVQAEYISDSNIYDSDFAQQVKSYVERLLVAGREDTNKFRAENWESVFWDQDIARPDMLVNELNEVHSDVDEKAKSILEQIYNESTKKEDLDKIRSNLEKEKTDSSDTSSSNSNSNSKEVGVSAGGSGWGFSASVSAKYGEASATASTSDSKTTTGSKDKTDTAKEQEKKRDNSVSKALKSDKATEFLKKSKSVVSWNGKKFVAKPMSLTRVNIGSQDSATRINNQQISLKYYSAALITAINIPDEEAKGDRVVLYEEIAQIKKNLSQINVLHKAPENKHGAANQDMEKMHKSVDKLIELQMASCRKDQELLSAVDLMRANFSRELQDILERERREKTQLPAIFTPFLHNITKQVQDIRNIFATFEGNRQIPSECVPIPTSLTNTGKNYYFCDKEMSWNASLKYCASYGMRLVTVDNDEVYKIVADYFLKYIDEKGLKDYSGFWVGASDVGDTGVHYWNSNGQKMTWAKWFPTEPTWNFEGVAEDCIALYKFPFYSWIGFADHVCDREIRFICEADKKS